MVENNEFNIVDKCNQCLSLIHDNDCPLFCDTCLFTSCSVDCFNEDITARKMC